MRDPARIDKFCSELAKLWKEAPDWRFGQLMVNVLGTCPVDPFFPEDDKMLQFFKDFFDDSVPQEEKGRAFRHDKKK